MTVVRAARPRYQKIDAEGNARAHTHTADHAQREASERRAPDDGIGVGEEAHMVSHSKLGKTYQHLTR